MKKIAFDVDDTLIVPRVVTGLDYEVPNYDTVSLYKWFKDQGNFMVVWSGSGVEWAKTWSEKLGLKPDAIYIKEKREDVDIAFDDCDVDLGKVNIKVSRFNNDVSRKDWNKRKTDFNNN